MSDLVIVEGPEVAIHQAYIDSRKHADDAVAAAIRCGELLAAQKKAIGHGPFAAWVQTHCVFSYRTARAYMQVARKSQSGSALPFSSIRAALTVEQPEAAADPEAEPGAMTRRNAAETSTKKELKSVPAKEHFEALAKSRAAGIAEGSADMREAHAELQRKLEAEIATSATLRTKVAKLDKKLAAVTAERDRLRQQVGKHKRLITVKAGAPTIIPTENGSEASP